MVFLKSMKNRNSSVIVCRDCGEINMRVAGVDFQTCAVCGGYLYDYRELKFMSKD